MTTAHVPPAIPQPRDARIGPPIDIPAIARAAAAVGFGDPTEVGYRIWRMDRLHPIDGTSDPLDATFEVTGYVLIGCHMIPSGWWAHLQVVGHAGDDSEAVIAELGALLYPAEVYRLDPVGQRDQGADQPWSHAALLPRVLHGWGPLTVDTHIPGSNR